MQPQGKGRSLFADPKMDLPFKKEWTEYEREKMAEQD
jgi:hypothetical protein